MTDLLQDAFVGLALCLLILAVQLIFKASKGKVWKVFIAVAFCHYCLLVRGILLGDPAAAFLIPTGTSVGGVLFIFLPLSAILSTFLRCWIPCVIMVKCKSEKSRRIGMVVAAIIIAVISVINYSSLPLILMFSNGIYGVFLCVILPYLYLFHSPIFDDSSSVLKKRFFITELFLFLIKFLETVIFSGGVQFGGGYDIFCFAILVSSDLIWDFLMPFAFVLFTKQEHKKKVMIGLALMRGMMLFLSDSGIIVSCLEPIIYTILPCFYIFGWFGGKTGANIPTSSQSGTKWQQDREASREKGNMADKLYFTVLGPSGAGKTTLLACMYHEFEEMRSGMLVPDGRTSNVLERAYTRLKNAANSPSMDFETAIEGTEDLREYRFDLKGKGFSIPIKFYDFPGGWMDPDNENYEKVLDITKRSQAVLVAVNTPYFMEEDGQHADEGLSSWTIQNILTKSYEGGDKLILLIPIKCEKYTETLEETRQMREKMKGRGIFKMTVGLMNNPTYEDMSMVLMPIHTVGNAEFKEFRKDDSGRVIGEVYNKTQGKPFSPRDTDQPLRFVMNFILNEYAKGKTLPSNIMELGNFIRSGMRLDDPNFEIIGGRDKLA